MKGSKNGEEGRREIQRRSLQGEEVSAETATMKTRQQGRTISNGEN